MSNDDLLGLVRRIPDFPKPGILFYDVTTLFQDRCGFQRTIDRMADRWMELRPDVIVGIDARGFILASALAYKLHTGLVLVRKKGKLPFRTQSVAYALEYGQAEVEIHVDAVPAGARALIADDLLATGGTAAAAVSLVRASQGTVCGAAFVIELAGLGGAARLRELDVDHHALITVPS